MADSATHVAASKPKGRISRLFSNRPRARAFGKAMMRTLTPVATVVLRLATPARLAGQRGKPVRRLEIGPGRYRVPGFETLNVVAGLDVDYIADAADRLPIEDEAFDLVYASHVLEHIPWYQTKAALAEWVRVIKPGGRLEIWVPDGLKIARAFVDAEDTASRAFEADGWWQFNTDKDPCIWMSGRCFSFGDGTGKADDPNWHRALFSDRLLRQLLTEAGLTDVHPLPAGSARVHDHGWINLGVTGTKPARSVLQNSSET